MPARLRGLPLRQQQIRDRTHEDKCEDKDSANNQQQRTIVDFDDRKKRTQNILRVSYFDGEVV